MKRNKEIKMESHIQSKYSLDIKSKYNIRELFDKHYGLNSYHIIVRRLQRELGYFDFENIHYELSFTPIYKNKYGPKILLEIQLEYAGYKIYIYIQDIYPFKSPILRMDKISIEDRKYRVQDGLENTPISFLHSCISEYLLETSESDLICVKDFVEKYFVEKDFIKDFKEIDPKRVYYQQYEHYMNNNIPYTLIIDYYYLLICRGIDLALYSK
jgi:hypothetical protein